MDSLALRVRAVECSLGDQQNELAARKESSKVEIGGTAWKLCRALRSSNQRIARVTDEARSFLRQSKYHDSGNLDLDEWEMETMDSFPRSRCSNGMKHTMPGSWPDATTAVAPSYPTLAVQLTWLTDSIRRILDDLESAEKSAISALSQAMAFQTAVMNISQEVHVQRHKLEETGVEAKRLGDVAAVELQKAIAEVEGIERTISDKQWEIYLNTRNVATAESQISEHQQKLKTKQQALEAAERNAKKSKKQAFGALATGIAGVGLAPFTFGGSLVLTGAAAGFGAAATIEYDSFKDDIKSVNSDISQFESKIQAAKSNISTLTNEQRALQDRVSILNANVTAARAKQGQAQSKIQEGQKVRSGVSDLQERADSTSRDTKDIILFMHQVKEVLDSCTAILNAQSVEIQIKTSRIDALRRRKTHHAMLFQREKAAMLEAVQALEGVQTKLPKLLTGTGFKVLDFKAPSVVEAECAADLVPIPAIVLRDTA